MKIIKLLLLLPAFATVQMSYAQQKVPLSLSSQYPEAGKQITITYDASGTSLNGKDSLRARFYYIDNKNFPVDEIDLKQNSKLWQGEVTINDSARAFVVQVLRDTLIDNNKGKGYTYLVYKDQKPVTGAYAAKAYIYQMGKSLGLDPDMKEAAAAYQKESELHAVNGKSHTATNYVLLAQSADPAKLARVNKAIDSLKKSGTENSLQLAITLLGAEHKDSAADSLTALAKTKYPNSNLARNALANEFFKTTDLAKKDSLYQVYIKDSNAVSTVKQYMIMFLTIGYLKIANFDEYNKYKSQLTDSSNLDGIFNSVAYDWAVAGKYLAEDEKLSKESIDIITAKINHPVSKYFKTAAEIKSGDLQSLDYYTDTYAFILYKEGKNYAEALKLEAPVWERSNLDADIGKNYALLLIANGDYDKATTVIEAIIKTGKKPDLNEVLKKCYIHKNGSDKGFDTYVAQLNEIANAKAKEALAKEMLSVPAPVFTLKDMDGNLVSLASLKGKTVIVDFWATWCGPCKASMPGMQIAVNKYRDDPNVKFLFIDVWEDGDDYLPKVKKFIGDNKYTFTVLIDEKDKSGQQARVISQFKVDGIPTKFIIDKNGVIRFKHVGYDGSDDAVVSTVSSMIDVAKM